MIIIISTVTSLAGVIVIIIALIIFLCRRRLRRNRARGNICIEKLKLKNLKALKNLTNDDCSSYLMATTNKSLECYIA